MALAEESFPVGNVVEGFGQIPMYEPAAAHRSPAVMILKELLTFGPGRFVARPSD